MLDERNRLIRSRAGEAGWKTIEKYERCELAKNEEDDKRTKDAEKEALNPNRPLGPGYK